MGLPSEDERNDHLRSIARSLDVIAKYVSQPMMLMGSDGVMRQTLPGGVSYTQDSHTASAIRK